MTTRMLWLLIQPSHLLFGALLLGPLFRRHRAGRYLLGAAILGLLIGGLLPAGELLLRPLEKRFAAPTGGAPVDGIIALAGGELPYLSHLYGDPQLKRHGDRLTSFLLLANRFPRARLAYAGGGTDPDYPQTGPARQLILGTGIDPARVVFERRSTNTCEDARYARESVAPAPGERWLLVTSAFHMPRAVACFRAVGWPVVPYPTDYQTGAFLEDFSITANLADLDLAVHEWLGLAYYRLRGYTAELWPQRESGPAAAPADR